MKYQRTIKGKFKSRPNRFIAYVEINGIEEKVHVKNTGRCKELLLPNAEVILEICDSPKRSTKYDLVAVNKEGMGWINMDSQAPNKVVGEWLSSQKEIVFVKPEYTYGDSRIDFYYETMTGEKILMEVKGVTLEQDGIAYFPDAPTLRGVKHMLELEKARKDGYQAKLAFVIQMNGINEVRANEVTHPEFAEVLYRVQQSGVEVVTFPCEVKKDSLRIIDLIR